MNKEIKLYFFILPSAAISSLTLLVSWSILISKSSVNSDTTVVSVKFVVLVISTGGTVCESA